MESGKWKVESGKWKVESGKQKVESLKHKFERRNWILLYCVILSSRYDISIGRRGVTIQLVIMWDSLLQV